MFDFSEKNWVNRMNSLDKVLANEKMVDDKLWACANPVVGIRTIFFVKGSCDKCFLCFLPSSFEIFLPYR